MTREGRKIYDPCADSWGAARVAPLLAILCNNVQIFGKDTESAPPTFIIKTLVERGGIAFDKWSGEWAAYVNAGYIKRTGFPSAVRLVGDRGKLSDVLTLYDGGNICIVPANPFFAAPAAEVARKVNTLDEVGKAMAQNLDAIKEAAAIIYNDPDLKTSIEQAEKERLAGKSTVKICAKTGQTIKLERFCPDAQSHIPELLALWVQTMEELDALTGRATIGEKSERRISDEVSVIENSACSAIDVIIDTFNRYCEWYGISARAERGTEIKRAEQKTPAKGGEENPEQGKEDNT